MDSKQRFSERVEAYVKYRPGYPAEALDYLYNESGFAEAEKIADIGAGTGIFSGLLLDRGSEVIAVEPNGDMRSAAEKELSGRPGYRTVDAAAERTGLPDGSVCAIVCAQAFHWFDREEAREEFQRILKPGGPVALIWNNRLTEGSPFLEAYERLLQDYGTDYHQVNHRNTSNIETEELERFFGEGRMTLAKFVNRQVFDFEGLSGRLNSSSYAPAPGHPNYEPMMAELRRIFDATQQDGHVFFDYETEVYWGRF
ncbi:class I SAM-dependent methyltransferase [Saccharibacillus alkalitolerans]|uniref:Class I SAM-dependent methyltransferase n=1 Tax=Saccharibacillus alkalitolerans TaxID=2705290 RepID=A0ABX0FB35_9BACL|nr:class I SAM-dependent methyltransferase [Saccharibacillus alkalitolerans]NGZ76451.1 class I SAM-dependent methyltransferase [Saccharibacillus alkalitolerans]